MKFNFSLYWSLMEVSLPNLRSFTSIVESTHFRHLTDQWMVMTFRYFEQQQFPVCPLWIEMDYSWFVCHEEKLVLSHFHCNSVWCIFLVNSSFFVYITVLVNYIKSFVGNSNHNLFCTCKSSYKILNTLHFWRWLIEKCCFQYYVFSSVRSHNSRFFKA